MDFEMDEQSYNDLSIFRNGNKATIWELFSGTRTVGGRNKMEEMMGNPSNCINVLSERREAIQFFINSQIELNISHSGFDLILHYLEYGGVLMRSNVVDAFVVYAKSKINPNQEYYNIRVGLRHLLPLLAHSKELSEILISSSSQYLIKLGLKIKSIVDRSDLKYAISLDKLKNLGFYQLARIDTIIRKECIKEINELLGVFYELDVFETLARVSAQYNFCLPLYANDNQSMQLEIEDLIHPFLSNPVATSIAIGKESNLMFLSGSNMSGKSSFLKSIGLAVYLSHLGFPVPAKKITTCVFNGLATTINLPDSMQNGLSHYYSEVVRVKKIAKLLTERKKMFILLDELFKGTNSKDAFEASLLVLNGFAEIKNSVFIISSHITELAGHLHQKTISLKYLAHQIIDGKPKFTYLLKDGVAEDGIGMYFIADENIGQLLSEAKTASES
jgi:DNA mismatch repair protein MutS